MSAIRFTVQLVLLTLIITYALCDDYQGNYRVLAVDGQKPNPPITVSIINTRLVLAYCNTYNYNIQDYGGGEVSFFEARKTRVLCNNVSPSEMKLERIMDSITTWDEKLGDKLYWKDEEGKALVELRRLRNS